MKGLLVVTAVLGGLLLIPTSAFAWTPDECADWYAEHGSNHPDCQTYVPPPPPEQPPVTPPPVQPPPVVPPPEVPPPPAAPPEVTPPVTPPVAPPVDTPPTDTPVDNTTIVDTPQGEADIGTPQFVKGQEEQGPGGGEVEGPVEGPVQPLEQATAETLPYTGVSTVPLVLAGLALLLTGYATRRALRP